MSIVTELLGRLGFLLFVGTLIPFVIRQFKHRQATTTIFTRLHKPLAFTSLAVLTLHGLLALIGSHGWRWGNGAIVTTGVISWLGLLAVVLLALYAVRKKPFSRTHCWFVILPVAATLVHVF